MPTDTQFKLIAEGIKGIFFRKEASIKINKKAISILVQTDKAIYKPGDLIRFRVLILDSHLKPANIDDSLTVFISVRFFSVDDIVNVIKINNKFRMVHHIM